MSHRVPQQMRMELEAAYRTVLVAKISDAPVGQFATLTDEDIRRTNEEIDHLYKFNHVTLILIR